RDFILKAKEHMKKNVVLFTLQWLERGLKDRPITRDISWGIEIPEIEESELRLKGAEKKRIYVWFEAVIGYLSASIEWARLKGEPEKWKDFWLNPEAKPYYFLGKDNIPFHSIIFPAILIGYGEGREAFTLPYNIPANEYLQLEGRQFSKSRGHLITVKDFLKIYPVDALRYYLTVMMPENRDASFVLDEFIKSVNSELVGNLGNFIHRALSFSYKHFGEVPSPGPLEEIDRKALKDMEEHTKRVFKYIERCEFKKGLKEVFALSQKANVYFDRKAPWSEVKKGKEKAATTLYISLQFVKVLSHLIYPFIPKGAERVWHYLNMPLNESNVDLRCTLAPLDTGTQLKKPSPVFKKLEKKEESLTNGGVRFEELELRIGTVVSVSEHPQAEKLYLLKVNLGKETRQLVAGIKPFYRKEELQKKKIVVLCNLKPRKIRGEVSNGMLLAAEKEKVVSLLSVSPEVEDGTSVKLVESYTGKEISFEGRKKNIDIKDFGKFVIKIGSLKEENGEAVVKLKNEVFSLDSHLYKLPSQKRCVVVLSPVKGVLAAGGELVTTDREEIKEGAHIR
ncbi:MAG TPA: methionine--tRNA ligase, partial [Thermoplasmata archaeon]|nr:methionine--tRNA ligase [Thermoplasmata archaeon]